MTTIFLAISVGDQPAGIEPDDLADDIVHRLNKQRSTEHHAAVMLGYKPSGPAPAPWMVSGIPAPQWLTRETLADLRAAAEASSLREDIRAVLTVYDEHVTVENRGPWRDRLEAFALRGTDQEEREDD